jgi:hypothetical protein
VLAARFEKYGLKIHPEKTRLLDFTKPAEGQQKGKESFTFLDFTHYWTKSQKGNWIVGRKTDKSRRRPVREQIETLRVKMIGHYAYYGISLNIRSITEFYDRVRIVWRRWLNRRSWETNRNWKSYYDYLKDWPLPKPRIMHSYC